MYIHLGGDVVIKKNKIVAIINLDTITKNENNQEFINNIKNINNINYISENGKINTLIITTNEYYLSPISAATIFKRGDLSAAALGAYDAEVLG